MWLLQVVELLLLIMRMYLTSLCNVYGGVRIGPHIVEESEGVNVELGFHWEFTKEKIEGGNRGGTAQFQKASKCLVMKQGKHLHIGRL